MASVAEWWQTHDPTQFVVLNAGGAMFRVTIEPLPFEEYPTLTPSEWAESGEPHPFGWTPDE